MVEHDSFTLEVVGELFPGIE